MSSKQKRVYTGCGHGPADKLFTGQEVVKGACPKCERSKLTSRVRALGDKARDKARGVVGSLMGGSSEETDKTEFTVTEESMNSSSSLRDADGDFDIVRAPGASNSPESNARSSYSMIVDPSARLRQGRADAGLDAAYPHSSGSRAGKENIDTKHATGDSWMAIAKVAPGNNNDAIKQSGDGHSDEAKNMEEFISRINRHFDQLHSSIATTSKRINDINDHRLANFMHEGLETSMAELADATKECEAKLIKECRSLAMDLKITPRA